MEIDQRLCPKCSVFLFPPYRNSPHWIGLRDYGNGIFQWTDPLRELNWTNWGPSSNNKDLQCTRRTNNGKWQVEDCGLERRYICEKVEGERQL